MRAKRRCGVRFLLRAGLGGLPQKLARVRGELRLQVPEIILRAGDKALDRFLRGKGQLLCQDTPRWRVRSIRARLRRAYLAWEVHAPQFIMLTKKVRCAQHRKPLVKDLCLCSSLA
jgi:hypothetical protein